MPCKTRKARDDALRTNPAVVTDMGAIHDEGLVPDTRAATPTRGPDMDRHMLTNDVVPPDLEPRGLAVMGRVLGLTANRRKGMNLSPIAYARTADHRRMRSNDHTGSELHFRANQRVRADLDIVRELRSGSTVAVW